MEYQFPKMTDLKIDLADGCDAVLDLLGQQLDNGNCTCIVRVDVGYFHSNRDGNSSLPNHQFSTRLSNDELNLVFQGIVCCLPRMKTLVVMSYFRADAMSLPASALEMLFRRANCLEILFLHQIKLHGSPEQFRIMGRSLDRHPGLKRVNLHCVCGSTDEIDIHEPSMLQNPSNDTTSLDPLVCGLAKLPTMYYLSLDQVPISELSIRALSESPSLRDVSFYNMPQIKSSLPILFQTLHSNDDDFYGGEFYDHSTMISCTKLRGLRIRSCDLQEEEAVLIANMLEKNSSLESVVFYVDSWNNYGAPLAAALAKNTSLKRLEIGIGRNQDGEIDMIGVAEEARSGGGVDDETMNDNSDNITANHETAEEDLGNDKHTEAANKLAQALKDNHYTALRHFCVNLFDANSSEIYDAYMVPFGRMLESNFVLENFLLQGANSFSVMSPKVGFLLRLNQRSGLDRRRLFEEVVQHDTKKTDTRHLWVEALGRHAQDLSIVHYLLCRNPMLVNDALSLESSNTATATATTAY